ncbi:Scramblase-domain-containing protein [Gongronella butleri]|nr:Scramblase-domain-containing protein [Gongronella butleri]
MASRVSLLLGRTTTTFLTRQAAIPSITRAAYSSLRRPQQTTGLRNTRRPAAYNPAHPVAASAATSHPQNEQPKEAPAASSEELPPLVQEENPHFVSDPVHTPVVVPQLPGAIVTASSAGAPLLSQSALVVGRELEMMNVFLGYEQANKYKIMDPQGNILGFIAEEEGFVKSLGRQLLRTHRPMKATILDVHGNVLFKIDRPFTYINSRIYIHDENDELIGEVQQRWHLLRRKFDLFIGKDQFAAIDAPFLSWDFDLQDDTGKPIGNINRNFVGFAREIFTDTGQYVLRMDAVDTSDGLTLDQRAVMLATAISIDFDYFSRHSSHTHGGFFPFPMFGGYGSESDRQDTGGQDVPPGAPMPPMDTPAPSPGTFGGAAAPPPPPPPAPSHDYDDGWLSDDEAGVFSPDDDDTDWGEAIGSTLRGFFEDR